MRIRINEKQRLFAVSPMLYGVFFEDINYGGTADFTVSFWRTGLLNITAVTVLLTSTACAGNRPVKRSSVPFAASRTARSDTALCFAER